MATYTPNLNLKKPSGTDRVLIEDLNDNFDKLDQAYAGGGGQGGGSVKILGTYETFNELRNSVTNPSVGDIYQVGTSAPYTLYLWNNGQWINIGGLQGDSAYVWIKYAADQPDSDDDMKDTPDQFIGIYSGDFSKPPTNYSDYVWYKIRGEKGDASYVHIRYSDDLPTKNTDMKDTPSNWMGVLVDTTKQPSGVYTDYQWFKIKGETGNGIQKVTFDGEDYTLTIHLDDGSQYTTDSIRGKTGNGIESIKLNDDYTLTITCTDGQSYTTQSIRGEIGPIGPKGPVGKSYTILGHAYGTLQELEADVLAPEVGDQYNVGTEPPYNVYRWTGTSWEDQGMISAGGGGAGLSDDTPQPLGEASPGDSDKAARANHVHEMPTAEEVGARPDTWTPTAEEVGARPDTWTPTAEEVGARADDWFPNLEEIGGTWKAGDSLTITNNEYIIYGFVTSDATAMYLQINTGKPISASGVTVKSFTAILRGVSGYLDANNEDVNLLKSPYTIVTSIASSRKQLGVIRMNISKSSKFTNVTNNTPIIVMPQNLTIEFT